MWHAYGRWSFWKRRKGLRWFRWVIVIRVKVWFIIWTVPRVLATSCLSGMCDVYLPFSFCCVDVVAEVLQIVTLGNSGLLSYKPMCYLCSFALKSLWHMAHHVFNIFTEFSDCVAVCFLFMAHYVFVLTDQSSSWLAWGVNYICAF